MKIGVVYTARSPELVARVEGEIHQKIGDCDIATYGDETILFEARDAGYVTPGAAARLVALYARAVSDGADAILHVCSSVGEAADSMRDFAAFCGVPIVRIDERMCCRAVCRADKIGVMATLSSTLEPTLSTLRRAARACGRRVTLVPKLVEVFGLEKDAYESRMLEGARDLARDCGAIVLAQGSMAFIEDAIARDTGIPSFSSPRYGAEALRAALIQKGLIEEND